MADDSLGGVLGLGDLVHQHYLEGVLKDADHVVSVELLLPAGAVNRLQVVADPLVPADIDLEATLHPQDGLHNTLDIVVVSLLHLRGAMNKGVTGGHLAVRPLHGDPHRLFGPFQESTVESYEGNKSGSNTGTFFSSTLMPNLFIIALLIKEPFATVSDSFCVINSIS